MGMEGQAINKLIMPSIYGVGEGAEYFHLNKVVYIFHPNTPLAMEKLRPFEQVVCEISKWKFRGQADNSVLKYHDGRVSTKVEEARKVAQLARNYSNLRGGFDDDLLGMIKREKITPDQYAEVYNGLKQNNPGLKLWTVVYSHELDPKNWQDSLHTWI